MAGELLAETTVEYKACATCEGTFPLTAFWKKRNRPDGRYATCIPCTQRYWAAWRAKNPEKVRASSERWRKKNPKYAVEWQRRNRDSHNESARNYSARNLLKEKPDPVSLKKCVGCEEIKQRLEFWVLTKALDGRHAQCVSCMMQKKRVKFYGVTTETFSQMWKSQKGMCGACGSEMKEHGKGGCVIDHCHKTGNIRGLLCSPCNLAIGHLKDDADRCEAAARYLRLYKGI